MAAAGHELSAVLRPHAREAAALRTRTNSGERLQATGLAAGGLTSRSAGHFAPHAVVIPARAQLRSSLEEFRIRAGGGFQSFEQFFLVHKNLTAAAHDIRRGQVDGVCRGPWPFGETEFDLRSAAQLDVPGPDHPIIGIASYSDRRARRPRCMVQSFMV